MPVELGSAGGRGVRLLSTAVAVDIDLRVRLLQVGPYAAREVDAPDTEVRARAPNTCFDAIAVVDSELESGISSVDG